MRLQRAASKVVDEPLLADLTSALDEASVALLQSQGAPFVGRVYTPSPCARSCASIQLPMFSCSGGCASHCLVRHRHAVVGCCGSDFDSLVILGDHRAACPRAALLSGRCIPLEWAAARICREAGATVAANVLRIAVVATALSRGRARGRPRRHQRNTVGAARRIARANSCAPRGAASSCLPSRLQDVEAQRPFSSSDSSPAAEHGPRLPICLPAASQHGRAQRSATVLAAGAAAGAARRSLPRRLRTRHQDRAARHHQLQPRLIGHGLGQWRAAAPAEAEAEVAAKEVASTTQRLLAQDVGAAATARTTICKHWRERSSGAGEASRAHKGLFVSGFWLLRLGRFLHSRRLLQPVRVVCKEAKKAPRASILCALAWLLCDERALPSALDAVAASGADAARGAIAPFGRGFSHISSCGSRKPPRSQRAAAPLRRTRVGEAANPGPSAGEGAATHGDATAHTAHDIGLVVQRDRAVEALARAGLPPCGLPPFPPLPLPAAEARARASFPHSGLPPFPPLPPPAMPAEVADTISDTDSRVSELAYLTPRAADGTGTPPGQGCDGAIAPTAPDASTPEASPSTPVAQPLPEQHQALRHQVPPLTGRLPPTKSWLCMPLLLDGAGLLSSPAADAWRSHAPYADTWPALVTTLVASAPVRATDLAAAVWSAAEADADPGGTTEDCGHVCSRFGAQPTACLTLRQAVSAAAGAHGYLTAATQSAFLQLFGGVTLAAEAAALADRTRAFLQTAAPRAPRRRRGRAAAPPPAVPEASGDGIPAVDATTDAPQVMRGAIGRQAWQDLDNIDVQAELRQPVPTLQDVPPFLRAGVRRALVFAQQAVRDADLGEGAGIGITPTRAWTLFMLTPRMLLARTGR